MLLQIPTHDARVSSQSQVCELWQWDLHITSAKRAKIIADCILGPFGPGLFRVSFYFLIGHPVIWGWFCTFSRCLKQIQVGRRDSCMNNLKQGPTVANIKTGRHHNFKKREVAAHFNRANPIMNHLQHHLR